MPSVRKRIRGFSLVELLITLVVAAILAGLAAPSIRDIIFNNRISTATNDLIADIATARSESARRGVRIALCKNATGLAADTACDTATTWTEGWLMFVDRNGNGTIDANPSPALDDTVLRVRQALPAGLAVTVTGVGNFVQARPVGTVTPVGTWKICDSRVGNFGRQITVSATGRASSAVVACP